MESSNSMHLQSAFQQILQTTTECQPILVSYFEQLLANKTGLDQAQQVQCSVEAGTLGGFLVIISPLPHTRLSLAVFGC